MKNWFAKLKAFLGFARVVSPEVDKRLKEAEELGAKAEQAAETARQVDKLIDGIRGLDK
jgi:hypothetical protein